MSSRTGVQPFTANSANSSSKGKSVFNAPVEQLSHAMGDISLESSEGGWEVYAKKNKNKAGSSAAKSCGTLNPNAKAWQHPDATQKLGAWSNNGSGKAPGNTWQNLPSDSKRPAGRGNARAQPPNRGNGNSYMAPPPAIRPPLEHGWNWSARAGSTQSRVPENTSAKNEDVSKFDPSDVEDGIDDEDDDSVFDSDDDLSDGFDSDSSQKSHGTRKKNRWFKKFFDILDSLTIEEINEPTRQWHCPACQGGPGAIDWYKGLQPLMTHAKTKGSKRVNLHRELAELLDEELQRRGTSVIPAGEAFGKWKGLNDKPKDREIVWPPMVMIMNTQLEQGDNDKWIGMGNQELLDYFSSYAAAKARHSYGPQGHRGISVLIFENSAVGYMEAERLHKHFQEQGTDRNAWDHRRVLFYPGGQRQLYGFMALKDDLDSFNKHSQGKMKLKFELRSYEEMVVSQMKQMSEDNQKLTFYRNRVAKEQKHSKAVEESFGIVSEKYRQAMEENRIVRQRTKLQHEQYKEQMDFLESFYMDKMQVIQQARDTKEDEFEREQQEKREKVKQLSVSASSEGRQQREEEIVAFIQSQNSEMEAFAAERDRLGKSYEARKVEMKKRHWEEEVKLEKEYDKELTELMEKYTEPK